jgi:predicted nucleic acid-binding protein
MTLALAQAPRQFLDTNVLVYWLQDSERAKIVDVLLEQRCVISVQVLNELAKVMRKKSPINWAELTTLTQSLAKICEVSELTLKMHQLALALSERYQFKIYDANIVAAAAHTGCEVLYSEDMQHGFSVQIPVQFGGGSLSIKNPFL